MILGETKVRDLTDMKNIFFNPISDMTNNMSKIILKYDITNDEINLFELYYINLFPPIIATSIRLTKTLINNKI